MCFDPPKWLVLPDRSHERLADNDALYCGETGPRSDGEAIALCEYHSGLHWLGIYGDGELTKAFESAMVAERKNLT
jgi:hypothetical protein